jgi:uncharacterized membrane protein
MNLSTAILCMSGIMLFAAMLDRGIAFNVAGLLMLCLAIFIKRTED